LFERLIVEGRILQVKVELRSSDIFIGRELRPGLIGEGNSFFALAEASVNIDKRCVNEGQQLLGFFDRLGFREREGFLQVGKRRIRVSKLNIYQSPQGYRRKKSPFALRFHKVLWSK
jgi:hypothetical protein